MPVDLPVLTVADVTSWKNWLVRNAATSKGVWLTLSRVGHTKPTALTYVQALDEALCQGWIDSQARGGDERAYAQRFTPRGPKSLWSIRNIENIARLERDGRITDLGHAAINTAKSNGRWDAAYAGQSTAEPPGEFLEAVAAVPGAQATWDSLTRSNRYAFYFRLNALKTQAGREKRIAAFVDMLARGESLHPQKRKPAAPARARAAGRPAASDRGVAGAVDNETLVAATAHAPRTRKGTLATTSPHEGRTVRRSTRLRKTD
ncbi:hypothetical protein F4777DRAFT_430674 [Nemania sp. FL0916]|nr:hypothetical protein F4777DRAFT_430674 [Nemania sp. FL0916]